MVGSAIIGSIATIILAGIIKHIMRSRRYRGDIVSYGCAEAMNHSYGKPTPDTNSDSATVWEHNNDPTETPGDCTIYGHYKNDFFEPGRYRVTFRLLVDGISLTDPKLIRLDVLRWEGDRETPFKELSLAGKDLHAFNGKYQDFSLSCYVYNPGGKWEYRAFVNRELFREKALVIRFDTITISHDWKFSDVF